jgi:hypothetical protein
MYTTTTTTIAATGSHRQSDEVEPLDELELELLDELELELLEVVVTPKSMNRTSCSPRTSSPAASG